MNIARLAFGLGVLIGVTACAAQRSPELNAPSTSATSPELPTPVAADQTAAPATPAAAPAPTPQGLEASKSKAQLDDADLSNLDAAERALNQAKADLDRLALAQPAPSVGRSAASDSAAEKKEGKPGRAPSAAGAAAPSNSNPVCEETCRAFSSLSRAASAVCRIDGSGGTHCARAKRVVADSEQRVARCSCPTSSD